jgi:hypothetical protein
MDWIKNVPYGEKFSTDPPHWVLNEKKACLPDIGRNTKIFGSKDSGMQP